MRLKGEFNLLSHLRWPSSLTRSSFLFLCFDPSPLLLQMALPSVPSTPNATPAAGTPSEGTGTPGKWRHPHLSEIVRRQNAATFSDKDVRKLIWNVGALIVTWFFGGTFKS